MGERAEKTKADEAFKTAQTQKMQNRRNKNEKVAKELISKVIDFTSLYMCTLLGSRRLTWVNWYSRPPVKFNR